MQFTEQELADRLHQATDADRVRGIFTKGVIAEVETLVGHPAAERCLDVVGRREFAALASYPVTDFLKLLWTAAAECEKSVGGKDEAVRRLGARSVDDFFDSAVGAALLTFVRGHPKRLITSAPIAYRSAVTYGDRTVKWTGEHSCIIVFARDFLVGPYHEGVILAALKRTGGKNVRAQWRVTGPLNADYQVSWE